MGHASLAEAQAAVKDHAISQVYVIVVKRIKRVGNRKKGYVKVIYYQCLPSNAHVVLSDPGKRMMPSRSSFVFSGPTSAIKKTNGMLKLLTLNITMRRLGIRERIRRDALACSHQNKTKEYWGFLRALVPNSRITTSIQHNEGAMLTGQDIRNIRNRELARMLKVRSLISALLSSLGDAAHHFSQVDSEQKLTYLLVISR